MTFTGMFHNNLSSHQNNLQLFIHTLHLQLAEHCTICSMPQAHFVMVYVVVFSGVTIRVFLSLPGDAEEDDVLDRQGCSV